MKNKKMVATLASLCLIVVAVVAAVVGVLAAVQQGISNSFHVSYTAMNVDANVILRSKGPGSSDWEAETTNSKDSVRFYARQGRTAGELEGKDYIYSWDNNEENFRGVVIYRFQFDNYSAHQLDISFTYTETSGVYVEFWKSLTADAANFDLNKVTPSWADSTGALVTPLNVTSELSSPANQAPDIQKINLSSNRGEMTVAAYDSAATTGYLFMIVALADVDDSVAAEDVGDNLAFTLVDHASVTP